MLTVGWKALWKHIYALGEAAQRCRPVEFPEIRGNSDVLCVFLPGTKPGAENTLGK